MSDTAKSMENVIDTTGYEPEGDIEPTPHDRPAVVELAKLLPKVAALAAHVNSEKCSDRDRARLREFVPGTTYFLLLGNLLDLRSKVARDFRVATKWSARLTIDWTRFFDEYHELGRRKES